MVVKRAQFKVEEINEDGSVVSLPEVETNKTLPVVDVPEVKPQAVQDPKDLGVSSSEASPDEVKDWLKDVKPDISKEVEKGSGFNFKLIFFFMFLILVIGAVVGGFFYYKKGVTKDVVQEEFKPVPVTIIPTSGEVAPTKVVKEGETLNKDFKVQILNGSGKVGEAGVFKSALIKLGFTSGNITTGNASTYDFKDTEVTFKEGVPSSLLEDIKRGLDKYTILKGKSDLAKDSKFDISITVGATK